MRAVVQSYEEGPITGVVEIDGDGYHTGTTVIVFLDVAGVPVVQIDTPADTETHELMRVYVNDALVSGGEVVPASQC